MKICASLAGPSDLSAPEIADADMIEIRTDLFGTVPVIGAAAEKPTIVTFRENVDLAVLPPGFSGSIDIGETNMPGPDPSGPFPKNGRPMIIRSHHDYNETPDAAEIVRLIEEAVSGNSVSGMSADVSKGAFAVCDLSDLSAIARAARDVSAAGIPHVILGMGPLGTVTRIRQNALGNLFTFAYVGASTAPGQLSVSEMKRLGDDCLITGLLGRPLGHSVSPKMHEAAFLEAGIRGKYLLFDTPSLEGLADVMRLYDIRGLNVTIPYKIKVIDYLDELDDAARQIGAVNTIINEGGKLIGSNTDFEGIRTAFEKANVSLSGARIAVMGSGGAARACLYLLSRYDCARTVIGRNDEAVRSAADDFCASAIITAQAGSICADAFDIIINATPIGMDEASGNYPIDINTVGAQHVVFDMVYNTKTPLVKAAERSGARLVSGADMLAGQGALSFEYWTGQKIDADVMRREIGPSA